jgi:hypothetical protein
MNDPSLPLHDAIVAKLKATPAVAAFVNVRVYDAVPDAALRASSSNGAAWPYLAMGSPQVMPTKYQCVDGAQVFFPVHAWAKGPQSVGVKQLVNAAVAALDEAQLVLAGHRLVIFEIDQVEFVPDPDPEIQHGVMMFRAETEPA